MPFLKLKRISIPDGNEPKELSSVDIFMRNLANPNPSNGCTKLLDMSTDKRQNDQSIHTHF